ncbi:MAG TPA: DUF4163 domain-containing protein [Candidatus Paceibacterota bacterium]|jgi:uncharacterized protein YxeA|nr:DUF4163 domain-containing protein [Candidatus Paceibacterota bacterium]HRZ29299.1 DUF4163 domain-containing protein [Candidatus Paceibacterota bacterium]
MKKIFLSLFLIVIIILGIYIFKTQTQLKNYLAIKTNTPTTTTTSTTPNNVITAITDKIISEDKDNYTIDVHYPITQNQTIDDNIFSNIEKQINEFKEDVKIPSPNSAKTTLIISYETIFNQDDILSLKFASEAYTGGAHPSHLI